METVENKYITVAYKLYAIEDGEKDFTEEATAEHPFQFISGLGLTLESFEDQVKDLKAGDKFDFTIACADAYGDFDEEHVIDLPKQIFEVDGKFDSERIVAGNVVPLMTSEGQRINGTLQEIKADVVVMDMNHPLAGCDLNFVGEVIESRPATNEELAEIARMMSGGGCSCGCDSCGDGCGDGWRNSTLHSTRDGTTLREFGVTFAIPIVARPSGAIENYQLFCQFFPVIISSTNLSVSFIPFDPILVRLRIL